MKIPGAKTIIKYKDPPRYNYHNRHGGNDPVAKPQWSYIYLKTRKKRKKKHGVTFIYEAEKLVWDSYSGNFKHTEESFISIHTIRSMFANKKPGEMTFIKDDWDVILVKTLLIS